MACWGHRPRCPLPFALGSLALGCTGKQSKHQHKSAKQKGSGMPCSPLVHDQPLSCCSSLLSLDFVTVSVCHSLSLALALIFFLCRRFCFCELSGRPVEDDVKHLGRVRLVLVCGDPAGEHRQLLPTARSSNNELGNEDEWCKQNNQVKKLIDAWVETRAQTQAHRHRHMHTGTQAHRHTDTQTGTVPSQFEPCMQSGSVAQPLV